LENNRIVLEKEQKRLLHGIFFRFLTFHLAAKLEPVEVATHGRDCTDGRPAQIRGTCPDGLYLCGHGR